MSTGGCAHSAHDPDPTPIRWNFGVFLLDQITHVGVNPSRNLKLTSSVIIFEVF